VLRKNALTLALLAAILALSLWFFRQETPPVSPTAASIAAPPPQSKIGNPKLEIPPSPPLASEIPHAPIAPAEASHLADSLNSPTTTIQSDLRVVLEIITAFRANFPRTGNPVGSNAEITAALTGRNSLHLALIPRDHPAINAAGELCDRYSTPFFFHAESGTHMEIRSAGPDKKMWTSDDVALSP
jgi:hypothetical protein